MFERYYFIVIVLAIMSYFGVRSGRPFLILAVLITVCLFVTDIYLENQKGHGLVREIGCLINSDTIQCENSFFLSAEGDVTDSALYSAPHPAEPPYDCKGPRPLLSAREEAACYSSITDELFIAPNPEPEPEHRATAELNKVQAVDKPEAEEPRKFDLNNDEDRESITRVIDGIFHGAKNSD